MHVSSGSPNSYRLVHAHRPVGLSQQITLRQPTGGAQRCRRRLLGRPRLIALVIVAAAAAASTTFAAVGPARAADAVEAKKIFSQRCTACHTYGKGIKVGPDLKGVTDRRKRPWLLKFIRGSQGVIKSGDPIATDLFQKFKQQRMPDWTDLSEAQITAILDWFAAYGPEQKEPDERNAELATPQDIARARALFVGTAPLASGGVACGACHSLRDAASRGASLGPDLTETYARYQDRALTLFLKKPCTPRAPELTAARYLTPDEAFAIKSYLRKVSLSVPANQSAPTGETKQGTP
jgi:mono/diheme cytochrome c family protein